MPRTAPVVHLRLLATSDLHACLLPFDYYTGRPDPDVGLLRVASLIEDARQNAPNCLLFDNGDTLQGTPLGDVAAASGVTADAPHPMIAAMNALRYDAATLGNHDFDYGIPFLDRVLDGTEYPVVVANAENAETGEPYRHRGVILTREVVDMDGRHHVLRIGVTGTAPPQVSRWNRIVLKGQLEFTDALAATRRAAQTLRANGADFVVALAHSGLGEAEDVAGKDPLGPENAARAISALPGVDAVVAGHTHEVVPEEACDCSVLPLRRPIVQPGALGSHLGCIDIALTRDVSDEPGKTGAPWRVERAHVRALPLTSPGAGEAAKLRLTLRGMPKLRRQVIEQHRRTLSFTDREIGETTRPLNTYFSAFAPCPATQLIADAQRAAARQLIENDAALRDLPLLSAAAPMRCGGQGGPLNYTDIPAGPLRLRHVADLYGYPNHLAVVHVTGAEVAEWLERSASIYLRIDPERPEPQPVINLAFAGYNFDVIDGLTYKVDLSQPARTNASGDKAYHENTRVSDLRLADRTPLGPDDEVIIATNTYRASGGGKFEMLAPRHSVRTGNQPVRDHIADYVRTQNAPIDFGPRPTFTLHGFGVAHPVLQTGPGALQHPGIYGALGLRPTSTTEQGFQRFVLAQ